jgi:hypothetical protein
MIEVAINPRRKAVVTRGIDTMARRGICLIMAALAVCGCTANLSQRAASRGSLPLLADSTPADEAAAFASDAATSDAVPSVASSDGGFATAGDGDPDSDSPIAKGPIARTRFAAAATPLAESISQLPATPDVAPASSTTIRIVASAQPEVIALPEDVDTPAPVAISPYKPATEDESKIDRFKRQIVEVPVDIRPTEGILPENVGAEKFAAEPTIDESLPSGEPASIFCSYTPWTICYRPLYFEDIALERYGKNVGCLQTGLSGVRFFGSVAALPYKMTRRPPRSCECSNGFSRPGDCPLPGYGNRRFQWDAALVDAAMVTAVVYIIP